MFKKWLGIQQMEAKVSTLILRLDGKVKEVKEKCMSADKMYARSNQIKYNGIEKRLSHIEYVLGSKLKAYHDNNKKNELKAAEDAENATKEQPAKDT